MATEVIHVKVLEDGSYRVTLDEPHGLVQAHRRVKVAVSGLKYDHAGKRVVTKGSTTYDEPYEKDEEVGHVEILLAGQTTFFIPKESVSIEFDDGSVHQLVSDVPAAPEVSQ